MKSSNDIYIDGTYFKNNPHWGTDDSKWKADVIANLLKKNNYTPAEITEVGCGAGAILQNLSERYDKIEMKGYDISPHAIEMAKQINNKKLSFFNEDITQKNDHTDLLLMIDVVEHVDDYYKFMGDLKSIADHFVFHIPLDLSCRTILKPHILLQQRESVGHIHYFSKEMVLWMLRDKGYQIIDWVYTKPVVDVNSPDNFKTRIKKILRNFSFNINQDLSAKLWGSYSMMIFAK